MPRPKKEYGPDGRVITPPPTLAGKSTTICLTDSMRRDVVFIWERLQRDTNGNTFTDVIAYSLRQTALALLREDITEVTGPESLQVAEDVERSTRPTKSKKGKGE